MRERLSAYEMIKVDKTITTQVHKDAKEREMKKREMEVK